MDACTRHPGGARPSLTTSHNEGTNAPYAAVAAEQPAAGRRLPCRLRYSDFWNGCRFPTIIRGRHLKQIGTCQAIKLRRGGAGAPTRSMLARVPAVKMRVVISGRKPKWTLR